MSGQSASGLNLQPASQLIEGAIFVAGPGLQGPISLRMASISGSFSTFRQHRLLLDSVSKWTAMLGSLVCIQTGDSASLGSPGHSSLVVSVLPWSFGISLHSPPSSQRTSASCSCQRDLLSQALLDASVFLFYFFLFYFLSFILFYFSFPFFFFSLPY